MLSYCGSTAHSEFFSNAFCNNFSKIYLDFKLFGTATGVCKNIIQSKLKYALLFLKAVNIDFFFCLIANNV